MAYGGGTWLTQNKILPGAYVNFSSVKKASATISDRGIAAAPFALSWGEEGVVRLIEQSDFLKDCFEIFGYSYSAPEMVHLREIFQHATKVFCYRLAGEESQKAKDENGYAEAKYPGKRGNDIRIVITTGTDSKHMVKTMVGTREADKQIVSKWSELQDSDWVKFTKSVTVIEPVDPAEYIPAPTTFNPNETYYELVEHEADEEHEEDWESYEEVTDPDPVNLGNYFVRKTTNVTKRLAFEDEETQEDEAVESIELTNGGKTLVLSGGADGEISGQSYDDFLEAIEDCAFNTLCCPVWGGDGTEEYGDGETDPQVIINQFVNYTKRMRDDVGAKFQLVCHKPTQAPDYEGVIALWDDADTGDSTLLTPASLTYWLTGAEAGCNINESLTNTKYNGELKISSITTKQSKLEEHIEEGHLVFHRSNGDIVILTDINSLVTLRENFGDMFQKNQTIRVCDQIANDLAVLFDKRYLGIVQNDAEGRGSWFNECVVYFAEMQRLRAITEFDDEIVDVEIGRDKDVVLTTINGLNIVNAMEKLYMQVICR